MPLFPFKKALCRHFVRFYNAPQGLVGVYYDFFRKRHLESVKIDVSMESKTKGIQAEKVEIMRLPKFSKLKSPKNAMTKGV